MKILILLKKWPGGVGGGVKNISKEFKKLGHEVDAISREDDLKIYSLAKSYFPIRKKVQQLMKAKNYDIIYSQDWTLAFPLLFPTRLFYKKHFCMFHGNQLGPIKVFQNIIGFLMGRHLLVMAPSLKRRFKKANINYCGVSQNQYSPLKQKRKHLGWIKKETELPTQETMEELSKRIGLPLLIAQGIPHEKMNEFYNQCQIFISLPPASAGFQASWLEAMMAGVPQILGNKNGAGEIQPFDKIPFGKENDVDYLEKAVRKSVKRDYIKWVEDNDFSWERHTKRLVKIFNSK